jgi:hypothetical protein
MRTKTTSTCVILNAATTTASATACDAFRKVAGAKFQTIFFTQSGDGVLVQGNRTTNSSLQAREVLMRSVVTSAVVVLFSSACTMAADLPADIGAAVSAAERSSSGNPHYDPSSLQPFFYENVMNHCIDLSFKDKRPFVMVIALDGKGRAIKVYREPSTTVGGCLEEWIGKTTFPPPPTSPYFAHFDMRFERSR